MRPPPSEPQSPGSGGQLASRLVLLWAGLAIGVGFVATPAKFLAPSLTLPVALDVGRHTFALCNRLELLLLAGSLAAAWFARGRTTWLALLAIPGVIVAAQALWLIPVLDARVGDILAGRPPQPSDLHEFYIAADAVKVTALVVTGFVGPRLASRSLSNPDPAAKRSNRAL